MPGLRRAIDFTAVLMRRVLVAAGLCAVFGTVWLAGGFPVFLDATLNVTAPPARADAIVCVGAGTTGHDLPTDDGWQRIYTSVALFADGFAPKVVFTGRGNATVGEAEIYADAAKWLGLPPDAIYLDPLPASTAEHPSSLLKAPNANIGLNSRLLLVTSNLHARRVLMTFRRRGYTDVVVVGDHTAATKMPDAGRHETTALPAFRPDHKHYDDPLVTLRLQSDRLLAAMREWAAIAVYKWRGLV